MLERLRIALPEIRPEADFSGEADFMTALKAAIGSDVDITAEMMDKPEYVEMGKDSFLFAATPASFALWLLDKRGLLRRLRLSTGRRSRRPTVALW